MSAKQAYITNNHLHFIPLNLKSDLKETKIYQPTTGIFVWFQSI